MTTARGVVAGVVLTLAAACARPRQPTLAPDDPLLAPQTAALDARPGDVRVAHDVLVRQLAPGVWMHVSLGAFSGPSGRTWYPSNGLLLDAPDGGMVLIDTGWNDAQTVALLDWAERRHRRPVRRAVITHAHEDRLGGLSALRVRGVPAVSLALTAALARAGGAAPPDSIPGLAAAPQRDPAGFELRFPGAGHAPDNIVVYVPAARLLFGGCLVKPDTATTVGNIADADVANWPRAVAAVRTAYPDARLVVPGHGAVGGPSALTWTERLIAEQGTAAAERLRRP
ncbi:subclass B1 metallo-beta-lactamase [Roseisolibacter agri]|uniref:beta-lactamase n=1 Tax=Roseisolibacter agri TaxID=2014610 RepID=A0AA37V077_9BACT|nr:subclass B1 metallo-beta-lactamase [Roseisolibacter agri]GLC23950.1 beta-lactamase [Roseisolibacter agri]